MTEEIKFCPDCGLRIKERYEAVKLLKEIHLKVKKLVMQPQQ